MQEGQTYNVHYVSIVDGNETWRTIIPTVIPPEHIKAIDVSHLSPVQQETMSKLVSDYAEYKKAFVSRMFNLEDWIAHTTGQQVVLEHRTFAINNLDVLG